MRLTVKQAAEHAGVSASLVYRWCQEARLPHYRLGGRGRRGRIAILPSDLDAFLEACKFGPDDALSESGPLRHIR